MKHLEESNDPSEGLASSFRMMTGIGLLVLGLLLGIYIVHTVVGLIFADEAPAIVKRVTTPIADKTEDIVNQAADNLANNARGAQQTINLSADVKQIVGYFIVCLLMVIPTSIAKSLIGFGVKLMHNDASDALQKIADRLR